jgi:hypothetical protein
MRNALTANFMHATHSFLEQCTLQELLDLAELFCICSDEAATLSKLAVGRIAAAVERLVSFE